MTRRPEFCAGAELAAASFRARQGGLTPAERDALVGRVAARVGADHPLARVATAFRDGEASAAALWAAGRLAMMPPPPRGGVAHG